MNGYELHLTCPRCGGELLPVDETILSPDLGTARARCDRCMDLLAITVAISVVEPWPVNKLDRDARRREGAAYATTVLDGGVF